MKILLIIGILSLGLCADATAQSVPDKKIRIDGQIVTARVENGDTLILANLDSVSVTSLRTFKSDTQYRKYLKYRRYANQVYKYAVRSIKIFREVERDTEGLKRGKRRKHVRRLQKELKKEFTDPLKTLTRTQGKIMVKMIEKELNTSMFDLLKNLKGRLAAAKWQTFGKLYGYNLKEGYIPGNDPILDAVLQDFNISYSVN